MTVVGLDYYFAVLNAGSGDTLSYSVTSDDVSIASAVMFGSSLNLKYFGVEGIADITVTATDSVGQSVSQSFLVSVTNRVTNRGDAALLAELSLAYGGNGSTTVVDPTIDGTIIGHFDGGTVDIEFDADSDGTTDSAITAPATAFAFTYDPRDDNTALTHNALRDV